MSDDEKLCYLLTVMTLAQWYRLAQIIHSITDNKFGNVVIVIKDGEVFSFEHKITERMNDK